MTILFHPKKNIGRVITINGEEHEISYITKDKKSFRIKMEEHGVAHDYGFPTIESAKTITISVNDGESWVTIPVEGV